MKKNTDRFMKDSMAALHSFSGPDEEQKKKMLQRVLAAAEAEKSTAVFSFKKLIAVYPWRFALCVSLAQAAAGTLIFGSGYANLFLQLIGR